MINQIRDRAWGNMEVGYDPNAHTNSKYTFPTFLLNTEKVPVPDAQEVYAKYKAEKGYKSDVWVVAITQERRKEFLQEFSFWYDLCRMGLVAEWLDCEYPKNGGATFYNTKTGKYYIPVGGEKNQPYRDASDEERRYMIPVTDRDWDWNPCRRCRLCAHSRTPFCAPSVSGRRASLEKLHERSQKAAGSAGSTV